MRYKIPVLLIFVYFALVTKQISSADCEKPKMPSSQEWLTWINEFKIFALNEGISKETIDTELNNIKPARKIILRDRCQVESKITLDEYLYYRLDKARVVAGKKLLKKYSEELNIIGEHFSIQPRFIISILGMESYYGKNQGKISTIEAVTTLAFDRRRSDFYKKQLIAALKIIDNNMTSNKLQGSWGGAIGMPQFIPTTLLDLGYDWDKDGKVDIWNNYFDTFASIANYLTTIDNNPWSDNFTWGVEVTGPNNINKIFNDFKQKSPKGCGAVKARSIEKKIHEWKNLGFKKIDNTDFNINENLKARLVAPDGPENRLFLVYQNYKNILYYNCSSYYAIAIGLLSDEIKK